MERFHASPDALLVVPTATMAEHLRRTLAREGRPVASARIQTLAQLLDVLSPLREAPEALVHLLLERELERNAAPRFHAIRTQRGFLRGLVRLFAEATAERLPEDLGQLFADVDTELGVRGYASRHARLEQAVGMFGEALAGEGGQLAPLLLFDGFFKFSEAEQELLVRLAGRSEVVVTLPNSHGAEPAIEALRKADFEVEELQPRPNQIARSKAGRTIFEAPTMEAEAEQIARRIVALATAGRPFREIGIVLRSREPYGPLLETTLSRFGIPVRAYFTDAASKHPYIAYLTGLVRAMLAGWDHELLLRTLRMPVSGLGATPSGDAFDFALRERIPGHGLPPVWRKLDKWDKPPALPAIVAQLTEWSPHRGERRGAEGWTACFEALTTLVPPPAVSTPTSRRQIEAWRSTAAAKRAFLDSVAQTGAALADAGEVPMAAFWKQLETTLELAQLRVPDDRRNVVHLLDAYEARQWELPVVFVCGMTERHFPHYFQQDAILPDSDRRRAGLDTSEDQQLDEPFLFRIATTRATGETILSYPKFDEKGEYTLPSFFLESEPWAQIKPEIARSRPRPKVVPIRPPKPLETPPIPVPDKLSASSIEAFLQCPFQFYVRKTVHLRERPKAPRDRLDVLLQGTILHEALAEWSRAPLLNADVLDRVFEQLCDETSRADDLSRRSGSAGVEASLRGIH